MTPDTVLAVELLFCRVFTYSIDEGVPESELLEARTNVRHGEYGLALTDLYELFVQKPHFLTGNIRRYLQRLASVVPPEIGEMGVLRKLGIIPDLN